MGHNIGAACKSQRKQPLNRPSRRECPERKPTALGAIELTILSTLAITHQMCLQTLVGRSGRVVLLACTYLYFVPLYLIRYPQAAPSGGSRYRLCLIKAEEETSKSSSRDAHLHGLRRNKRPQHSPAPSPATTISTHSYNASRLPYWGKPTP